MKENNWQLWWYFFKVSLTVYGCSLLLQKFPYKGENMQKYLLKTFRYFFFRIANVKLLQSSFLFQTILSNYFYWNAFVNPKRKHYVWKLWYPIYKKQYCKAQKEMIIWNNV